MRIVFSGYYNGFNVEVRSAEEITHLHEMGCFGKGSASRSRPTATHRNYSTIMRKRQFLKRNYWYKKFDVGEKSTEIDSFLKEVDRVTAKIIEDSQRQGNRDIIDLVSSDDNVSVESDNEFECNSNTFKNFDKDDIIVVVSNSDSEEDDYFSKIKPKCCINRVKLQEKLMLTLEEAFFLLYGLGTLQIINSHNNILSIQESWDLFASDDEEFVTKYVVYHFFRSKGYIVKPGVKFGGNYLLYKKGPETNHADYVVIINSDKNLLMNTTDMLGLIRMTNTTAKEVLIAQVTHPQVTTKMPEGLKEFTVREILLSRNLVTINDDD